MKLDEYISNLLIDHDCVIVPEFGGFVANYAPAKINGINNRVEPPYRKISFNKLLLHNDGLLAAYVAQKEQEAYADALGRIRNYALYLKAELMEKNRIQIDRVGVIYRQNDGSLRFEQVKNVAFFKEAFGLDAFFAEPILRQTIKKPSVEPKAESFENKKIDPTKVIPLIASRKDEPVAEGKEADGGHKNMMPNKDGGLNLRKLAAAAAAIPVIGYLGWLVLATPLIKDSTSFHYSDLNPFSKRIGASYNARQGGAAFKLIEFGFDTVYSKTADFIALELENNPDKTLVVKLKDNPKKAEFSETLRYHVVGGCFSVEQNATNLAQRFRQLGHNASIIDQHGGLHRVSLASFASRSEALEALDSLKKEVQGAWILHK